MEPRGSLPHSQEPAICPCPEPDQSSSYPHPTSWILFSITSHLPLGLPSGLFSSEFFTKTLYPPLVSSIRAICPAHLILLDLITRMKFREKNRSLSSSLYSLLHFPLTSSLLSPPKVANLVLCDIALVWFPDDSPLRIDTCRNSSKTKKMQCYTIVFITINALHVSGVPPPIIRSSKLYTQHRVFVELFLLLTAIVSELEQIPDAEYTVLSSSWWAEEPPETCRAFIVIKTIV